MFDNVVHVKVDEAVHPSALVGLEGVAAVDEIQDKRHPAKAPVL